MNLVSDPWSNKVVEKLQMVVRKSQIKLKPKRDGVINLQNYDLNK